MIGQGKVRVYPRPLKMIVRGRTQEFGHERFGFPSPRPFQGPPRTSHIGPYRQFIGEEAQSGLGKLAFAFLWLLVFAIPWEDAVTISGFGTSARLIGMAAMGLGTFAIVETGRVRRPAPAHIIMALFVLMAAASYMWSLSPEGTLVQAFS